MNLPWQESTTIVIVLAAVGYVAWRIVRFVRRKGMPDCRCCPNCSADVGRKVLVTLDAPTVGVTVQLPPQPLPPQPSTLQG